MRKILSVLIIIIMMIGIITHALAMNRATLDSAVNDAAAYMLRTVKNPMVDSVGGEWAVIGLARSSYDVPDSYYAGYYRAVESYVREHGAILHDKKYTDNSRVILGLTAAGYDPRDVAGYDLTMALGDFERTIWQGINGPIFALIALDSMNYPMPVNPDAITQATRDMYVSEILRRQLNDGGWNLVVSTSEKTENQSADPDLTGMALQALAKYQSNPDVKAAIDRALIRLSEMQNGSGGYTGWGSTNVESAVQVLIALCEVGIPVDDARFVKDGKTLIDNILTFKNSDGSFDHTADGSGNSQMSSEQSFYGLVAAQRALDGRSSLYSMGDAVQRGGFLHIEQEIPHGAGLPGKSPDVGGMPVSNPGKTFPDIQDHKNQAAIEALAERGIISGKSDASFDPNAKMTRAEFATIVVHSLGLPEKTFLPFTDVSDSKWYARPVATAFFYGFVTGTSETAFNPDGTITRQEAAVLVERAARLAGIDTWRGDSEIRDTLAQFGDYRTVAIWAQSSMAFCYDAGILSDTEFDIKPGEAIRRCEIAETLYRMLDKANLL